MGTRADFYIGRGVAAQWLASIAFDGYPEGIDEPVLKATSEGEYRQALEEFFADRDDVTLPAQGWPWPWEDSNTTDYAYAFDEGHVWFTGLDGWRDARAPEPTSDEYAESDQPRFDFPDMTKVQSHPRETLGTDR